MPKYSVDDLSKYLTSFNPINISQELQDVAAKPPSSEREDMKYQCYRTDSLSSSFNNNRDNQRTSSHEKDGESRGGGRGSR